MRHCDEVQRRLKLVSERLKDTAFYLFYEVLLTNDFLRSDISESKKHTLTALVGNFGHEDHEVLADLFVLEAWDEGIVLLAI